MTYYSDTACEDFENAVLDMLQARLRTTTAGSEFNMYMNSYDIIHRCRQNRRTTAAAELMRDNARLWSIVQSEYTHRTSLPPVTYTQMTTDERARAMAVLEGAPERHFASDIPTD